MRTYAVVPTALGGVVLAAFPLFLRSSSFTGSLTLTPWYGLDADASDSAVPKNTSLTRLTDMSMPHDECTKKKMLLLHFKNHVGISYSCQVKQGVAESVESFCLSTDTSFICTFLLFCFV